jgi:hypothetical protein
MPVIPTQPSDITRIARVAATYTTDPEKKSRTFVAPVKYDIATVVTAALPGTGTILAPAEWKSPAFAGGRIFRL